MMYGMQMKEEQWQIESMYIMAFLDFLETISNGEPLTPFANRKWSRCIELRNILHFLENETVISNNG